MQVRDDALARDLLLVHGMAIIRRLVVVVMDPMLIMIETLLAEIAEEVGVPPDEAMAMTIGNEVPLDGIAAQRRHLDLHPVVRNGSATMTPSAKAI